MIPVTAIITFLPIVEPKSVASFCIRTLGRATPERSSRGECRRGEEAAQGGSGGRPPVVDALLAAAEERALHGEGSLRHRFLEAVEGGHAAPVRQGVSLEHDPDPVR